MIDTTWLVCGTIVGMVSFSADWDRDYGDALQAARQSQRPLVVILEDPSQPELRSGCQAKAEPHLLKAFEICRVDATTAYGKKLASLYGVKDLPYTVITDSHCRNILFRGAGHFSAETWNSILSSHAVQEFSPLVGDADSAVLASDEGSASLLESEPFSHHSLQSAQAAAKRRNRPVVVFVTMQNCHYCTKMKHETLTNHRLRDRIAHRFESVIVRRAEHMSWLNQHGVAIFPTTLVVGPQGDLLDRVPGYVTAGELEARLDAVNAHAVSQH